MDKQKIMDWLRIGVLIIIAVLLLAFVVLYLRADYAINQLVLNGNNEPLLEMCSAYSEGVCVELQKEFTMIVPVQASPSNLTYGK